MTCRAYARIGLVATVLLLAPGTILAEPSRSPRGWGYLVDKLAADGVDRPRAEAVFADPRMEPFGGLYFSLEPGESHSLYRAFLRPASVAGARRCLATHADAFAAAERARGVPASVLAALLHVESSCGRNTGAQPILPRLARLAMAAEPANLERNLERRGVTCDTGDDDQTAERTRARARALEAMFYPEVRATFELADRLHVDPLEIRGSEGGAFGAPQFLPTSYLRYGVDADGDGRVSLYDPDDAIASCANYLAGHGWEPGLSRSGRRTVLWAYNHSAAYVDTVLTLAERLRQPAPPLVRTARREHRPSRTRAVRTAAGNKRRA